MHQDPVFDQKLLSPRDCRRAFEAVKALRPHWIEAAPSDPKDRARPHFHLGAWAFKGTSKGLNDYFESAARINPILRARLDWIYEALSRKLQERLGAPVRFEERLGLPGFNIFLAAKNRPAAIGHMHFDFPAFRAFGWPQPKKPENEFITYIMPISLPASGAGLDFWDLSVKRFQRLSPARRAFELACTQRFHPYKLGVLSIQRGFIYHRGSGTNGFPNNQSRITFQGHGYKHKGRWILYL